MLQHPILQFGNYLKNSKQNILGFDLSNELLNHSFVNLTIAQITKDFERISVTFDFVRDDDKDLKAKLISQIETAIGNLNAEQLQQFIYLIDINEIDFVDTRSNLNSSVVLAEKIIEREAYKVFLRKYFYY